MINIARILSECPKNTKLYSPIFGDVYLYSTSPNYTVISVTLNENGKSLEPFFSDGRYTQTGECMLFPSKEQRNWHKFQIPFKDGDIISNDKFVAIFYNFIDDHLFYHCWYNKQTGEFKAKIDFGIGYGYEYKYATEEERRKLFKVAKNKGYCWDPYARKIEKLIVPKFKKGDKIRVKNGVSEARVIEDVCDEFYRLVSIGTVYFVDQDNWELVPNKFDLNTLIPFESKVLVRHSKDNKWTGSFFSFIDRDLQSHCYKFVTTADKSYPMMIPYKGNEYLLGKTEDCKDFYKTWE